RLFARKTRKKAGTQTILGFPFGVAPSTFGLNARTLLVGCSRQFPA
ncbi:MAG: hypothetical protein ACI96M_003905, partial [Candidatus Azotimanducaceae bacterium]